MWIKTLFLAVVFAAAVAPLMAELNPAPGPATDAEVGPVWPTHFLGRLLTRYPLSAVEQRFARGFPGQIARFGDGEHEIILRRVERPTRQLHPAADCFRGLGYQIEDTRVARDRDGLQWRCFKATRSGARRAVCERLYDEHGQTWTDTSAWFWAALLGRSQGPWWAITVASDR